MMPWRRERPPTPVFWPGEFHGLYSPWGPKESGMTEMKADSLPSDPPVMDSNLAIVLTLAVWIGLVML